ncbi:MAG: Hsp33 family molecular chaperone HslO [Leptotrichiaceae bacterium]|nr:Hsp33 family molecular chaperone HslO [Leptotrichiaceae bacterium]
MEKSELIRGTSKCARFFLCDTTEIVREAKRIHKLDPVAVTLFGKLLTAAVMMGKDLKGENDLLTLRISGEGPYGTLLATANKNGEVKGYTGNPEENFHKIVDENGEFITDETGQVRFIGNGTLQVIKDMGLKEPFVGLIKLDGEDISDIMAYYFLISEQVKSVVTLGVKMNENGDVEKAGGYIIQLLPGVEDTFIDKLEDKLRQIRSITELLTGGFSLERIVELLYEDISVAEDEAEISGNHVKKYVEDYEILEKSIIEYKCNCTKEKFYKGIITLGKKEIEHILEEEGEIEVECHFCGKKYKFLKEDFKDME